MDFRSSIFNLQTGNCKLSLATAQGLQATGVSPCAPQSPKATRNPQSQFAIRKPKLAAFTLTELLVVMGLIVLLITIAIPSFRLLGGTNSVASATNIISASLSRARTEAVGLQRPHGIAFYKEAASARYAMALVEVKSPTAHTIGQSYDVGDWIKTGTTPNFLYYVCVTPHTAAAANAPVNATFWRAVNTTTNGVINGGTPTIDVVAGSDRLLLPQGVACRTASDNYYPEGIILFDENGALTTRSIVIAQESQLYQQVNSGATGASTAVQSQIGLMLFDDELGNNNGYAAAWISNNAMPLLVNRYNGTILKGE